MNSRQCDLRALQSYCHGPEYDLRNGDFNYYRARYYEPDVSRFISEDPVRLNAGPGFYKYVQNNPILFVDPTGLKGQWTTAPPDPTLNTIVCDGTGGIDIQIGSPGPPDVFKCVGDCMRQHEQYHRREALADSPRVCKGKAHGVLVGPTSLQQQAATETAAIAIEIDCLKKKAQSAGCNCKKEIDDRVKRLERYREKFAK